MAVSGLLGDSRDLHTILYTNINSLRKKIDLEFETSQFSNVLAITLTETHLGPGINSGELHIRGYQLLRNDRDGSGGGVTLYIKSDIQGKQIRLNPNSDSLLVNLQINNTDLCFSSISPTY